MKNNSSRKLLFTTIAIVVLTLLSAIVINLFTGKKDVTDWLDKIEFTYLVVAVIVIGIALILFAYLQNKYAENSEKEKESLAENIEPDVKKLFDSLKERYQKRYESKLDERFEIKLEVSEDWDGKKTQTFNERYDKDAKISEAFPRLKELFETKDGLLIVGEPGAGKTVLLLKVALNLLENTNLKEKQPFPVIFNLASWNKDYKDFGEWLKAMLVSGNGLSKDFAERLLREKRFILLLDGLDELARNDEAEADKTRAACLESLNNYLDGEKTLICCRIDEFAAMQKNTAQDAPVSAKVEVLNLTEAELLNALDHAQNHADTKHHASAKNLSELIAKDENAALRKILCTPFYFTIALEVFYKRLPAETNLPHDEKELGTYLIEKYVERKLDKTPNSNGFGKAKTKKWLNWLARLMERKHLVTFELAHLQPTELEKKWLLGVFFGLASGIFVGGIASMIDGITGLFSGLLAALFLGFIGIVIYGVINKVSNKINPSLTKNENLSRWIKLIGFSLGMFFFFFLLINSVALNVGFEIGFLIGGIVIGLFFCVMGGFIYGLVNYVATEDIVRLDFTKLFDVNYWKTLILLALPSGGVFGLFYGLGVAYNNSEPDKGFIYGLSLGLFFSIFFCLLTGLEKIKKIEKVSYIQNSYQRINGGFIINILFILLISASLIGFISFLNYLENEDFNSVAERLIIFGTVLQVILIMKITLFKHIVLRILFYLKNKIPLKYATFLDYAAEARILEKDGGQWRFRHQNLQEYFANLKVNDK